MPTSPRCHGSAVASSLPLRGRWREAPEGETTNERTPDRPSVGGDAHAVERSGTSTLGVHRPAATAAPWHTPPLCKGRWQRAALTEGLSPLRPTLSKSRHTPPKPPKTPTLFKIYQNSFNLHTRFFKIFPCLFKAFSKKFHFFPAKSLTTHR